jgi:4-azaleucine resistance transporter AzlC
MTSARTEFFNGVKAELPILAGTMPFGMIFGTLAVASGLPGNIAFGMSSIVFAGSAQFVTTQLIAQATPWFVIILTAAVINVRHVLYSASIAPHVQHLPARWKALIAYLLTDEAYAVAITRYNQPDQGGPYGHWFAFGAGFLLWASWQISTAIGIVLGALVPASWSLDFALPLTFIALVVPALRERAMVTAAVVAGVVAVIAFAMPLKLGLITAVAAGIIAGLLVEANT